MKGTPIIDDDGRNKGEQTIVWALSPFHEPCQGEKGKTEKKGKQRYVKMAFPV